MNCLERLPDELLLELFEKYLRIVDLYIGFYLLHHRRLNSIIKSTRLFIDIPSKDVFHAASFTNFAPQIVFLRVSAFCGGLDLSTLVNLRHLHIEKPTRTQLISIHPTSLPHLHYLSLSPCWYNLSELPRVLAILPQSCLFEHLRCCVLPDGRTLHFPSSHSSDYQVQ